MTNLSMVAAVIDVARARPARPLKEFFQRPQMPIREMYLYRFLVNLTWYARNYMNIVLLYIFASALFYPLFLLNLGAAGLLHFVRIVGRRDDRSKGVVAEGSQQASSSAGSTISEQPIPQSSKLALKAVSRTLVNGLHDTADNFLKAASGCDLDTPLSSGSSASSPNKEDAAASAQNDQSNSKVSEGIVQSKTFEQDTDAVIKRSVVPNLNISATKKEVKLGVPPPKKHQHITNKKHTLRSTVFKVVQMFCCCVVFWSYGVGVCFIATLIPVFIICLHAVLTPYDDEASEFFENAAKSRGSEVDAPSTPVQAFQGKQETSFSASREKFQREAKPAFRLDCSRPSLVATTTTFPPLDIDSHVNTPAAASLQHGVLEEESPKMGPYFGRTSSGSRKPIVVEYVQSRRYPNPPNRSPRTKYITASASGSTVGSSSGLPSYHRSSGASGSGFLPPHSPTTAAVTPFSMEPRSIS